MIEPLYELKKDVNMPGHYYRAGQKKTETQWRLEFLIPQDQPFEWHKEWFIFPEVREQEKVDRIREIVDAEFERLGLHSRSYHEAAMNCVRKALTEFCKNESI